MSVQKHNRPKGYWDDYETVLTEARCIYLTYGYIPQNRELYKDGKSSFCAAVARHGGRDKVKRDIGIEEEKEKPASYYKDIAHARAKVEELVKELGHFPTQSELDERKETEFRRGAQAYHNGLRGLREKLGYESDMRPRGHWKVWKRIDEGLNVVIRKRGHFPSYAELREDNPALLKGMVSHHGGYNAVREKKGYALSRKKYGHWEDKEKMRQELEKFMEEHKLNEIPTDTFLSEHGASSLASAIRDHGGFRSLRREYGEETEVTKEVVREKIGEPLYAFFKREYDEKHRSPVSIGEEWGVHPVTVLRWIKREGMNTRSISENRLPKGTIVPSEEILNNLYWGEKKSTREIGEMYHVSNCTITRWLIMRGIRIKDATERQLMRRGTNRPSKEMLQETLIKTEGSTSAMAKKYGVTRATIRRWLDDENIQRKSREECHRSSGFIEPKREQLVAWYVTGEESQKAIAQRLGISRDLVCTLLNKNDIHIRKRGELVEAKRPSDRELGSLLKEKNYSLVGVAKETGVSPQVIKRWAEEAQIQLPTIPSEAQLRQWYEVEKKTTVEIGKQENVEDATVGYWLRKYGIKSRDKRGMYNNRETRLNVFQEFLALSGKKAEVVSSFDFQNYTRPDGTTFAGLLNWYRREKECTHGTARDYLLEDLAGLPLGTSVFSKRAKSVKMETLKEWKDFKKAIGKLFDKHPELQNELPSSKWLRENGYNALNNAMMDIHGGATEVRERLGQKVLRVKNGLWKELSEIKKKLEEIVRENPELKGGLPSSTWLLNNGHVGMVLGMRRYHGGYTEVMTQLRAEEQRVTSLLEAYVNE